MAYADTNANSTNRKLGTGAAVLVLEAGLAWAVVTGLATGYVRQQTEHTRAINIDLPKIMPKPVPTAAPTESFVQTDPKPVQGPLINLGPTAQPSFAADDGAITEVTFPKIDPLPLPSPKPPSFAPKFARPKGKTANWVTTNDYPTSALRQELSGTTRYRLAIDASGKVSGCTIAVSSGHAELDQATCEKLTRRAQFEPATNEDGTLVAGSFSGAVTWQLPQD